MVKKDNEKVKKKATATVEIVLQIIYFTASSWCTMIFLCSPSLLHSSSHGFLCEDVIKKR